MRQDDAVYSHPSVDSWIPRRERSARRCSTWGSTPEHWARGGGWEEGGVAVYRDKCGTLRIYEQCQAVLIIMTHQTNSNINFHFPLQSVKKKEQKKLLTTEVPLKRRLCSCLTNVIFLNMFYFVLVGNRWMCILPGQNPRRDVVLKEIKPNAYNKYLSRTAGVI